MIQSSAFVSLCASRTSSRIPHWRHITFANCLTYLAECNSAILWNKLAQRASIRYQVLTFVEPPVEDTYRTTHSPSLGTAIVGLLRVLQHTPSRPFDSSSSTPFHQGLLGSALYKVLQSLSGEASLLPAVYSIAAHTLQNPSAYDDVHDCKARLLLAVKNVSLVKYPCASHSMNTSFTLAISFPCARGRRCVTSFAAIIVVTAFLTTFFRALLLADLNSSSRGRIRSTSSEGNWVGSSASDMRAYKVYGR